MATRGGVGGGGGAARPAGTDGTDYTHREKVASQYIISVETKRYVRYSIFMHLFISMVVWLQVACYFGNKYFDSAAGGKSGKDAYSASGSASGSVLFDVPRPQWWQYIWLTSLVPALAGYMSLHRSRLSLIKLYYRGTVVLGLGPVLVTMIMNANDLLDYAYTKKTSNSFHNFPVIVLGYMYLAIVVQIHAFGIYFARILIRAWSTTQQSDKSR